MNKTTMLLGAVLAMSTVLTGCRREYEADLSPDGATLAQATPKGLSFRPADGGEARMVLQGSIGSPKFSPDGKTVVVAVNGKRPATLLVDVASGKARTLSVQLEPPYAWRPDGTELIGWQGSKKAEVVHIASGEAVRSYALDRPNDLRWLPGGRDLALAYKDRVTLVRKGEATSVAAELPSVAALGVDDNRLIWIETESIESEEAPRGQLRIRAYDLATREASTIRNIDEIGGMLGGSGVPLSLMWPVALSVSPAGDRVAVSCLMEKSGPEMWKRYTDLYGRIRKDPKDKTLHKEIDAVIKRLKFEAVTAAIALNDDSPIILARASDIKKNNALPIALRWSADGTRLALVYPDSAKVVTVTH